MIHNLTLYSFFPHTLWFISNIFKKHRLEKLAVKGLKLYAGDFPVNNSHYDDPMLLGLSIDRYDKRHILHDITTPIPLPDSTVLSVQAEDVFEHIEYDALVDVINEIYRVLKPAGCFRLSVPDYRSPLLYSRSYKDSSGNIYFDPCGGGDYINGKLTKGAHLWFPVYENVKSLIEKSDFQNYNFYHYYDENNNPIVKEIDYSIGWIQRVPGHDDRVIDGTPLSIVVDMIK